jgi:hypothetical protein
MPGSQCGPPQGHGVNPVRRISESLREMRWAQLILELVLLILGILIALAVDGWMDDRRDARSERRYLELMVRDLDRDLEVLDEFLAYEERQVTNSVFAYRALRGGVAAEDREAVADALTRLTWRRTLRLTRATYTDLLSTGNLRLIRTPALRDRIVGLYENNQRTLDIRDLNNQVFIDDMFLQYLWNSGLVAPRPASNLGVLVDGPRREFAERVAMPIETANDRLWQLPSDSPERVVLANKVWMRGLVSTVAIAHAEGMAGESREVREAITAELARRWPN